MKSMKVNPVSPLLHDGQSSLAATLPSSVLTPCIKLFIIQTLQIPQSPVHSALTISPTLPNSFYPRALAERKGKGIKSNDSSNKDKSLAAEDLSSLPLSLPLLLGSLSQQTSHLPCPQVQPRIKRDWPARRTLYANQYASPHK